MSYVSVAIISHNYGRFLGEAIDSVLAQTLSPREVLVIDDASTDNTAEVAGEYADRGVTYCRVENRSVWKNRLLAFRVLTGEWILCLDADNTIPPGYLAAALTTAANDPRCGVVHPSLVLFGDENGFTDFSSPAAPISVRNHIDATSVYRRDAVLQAQLDHIEPKLSETAEDWVMGRRVLANGWRSIHNTQPAHYRVHGQNKHAGRDKVRDYYDDGGLEFEPVTIVVPLSGRSALWPNLVEWFNWQTWPAEQCRIMLIDNSHDPTFERTVKQWIANCDYADLRYIRSTVGRQGLADETRTGCPDHDREVHRTVAALYNRAFIESSTDYVLTLEDDIEPPVDAIETLLRTMRPDIAAVTAAYKHRNGQHWLTWRGTVEHHRFDTEQRQGIEDVTGSGFGCLLVRRPIMNSFRLTTDGPTPFYDMNAADTIQRSPWRCVVNWDVVCQHHAEVL